MLRNNIKFTYY